MTDEQRQILDLALFDLSSDSGVRWSGEYMAEVAAALRAMLAENAALKANDPLNDAANHACGELPEGWMVSVDLERNAATVWLVDPANNYTDVHEDETSISDLVREAIRRAKEGQP